MTTARSTTRRAPRYAARRSSIHGRGVFARAPIARGEYLMDYGGEKVRWDDVMHDADPSGHTFLFDLGDDWVIDGGRNGNTARWINHGCDPNCETVDVGGRIEIHAIRRIRPGDELLIDYGLIVDDVNDPAYRCECGSPRCRGTMASSD